jgi:hypothetical protein
MIRQLSLGTRLAGSPSVDESILRNILVKAGFSVSDCHKILKRGFFNASNELHQAINDYEDMHGFRSFTINPILIKE